MYVCRNTWLNTTGFALILPLFCSLKRSILQGSPRYPYTPILRKNVYKRGVFWKPFPFIQVNFEIRTTFWRALGRHFFVCLRSLGIFYCYILFFLVTFSQQSSLICIHRKACAKSAHQTKHRHSRSQKKEEKESRAFLCTQKNNEEYPSISFCRLIPSALRLGAAKLHPWWQSGERRTETSQPLQLRHIYVYILKNVAWQNAYGPCIPYGLCSRMPMPTVCSYGSGARHRLMMPIHQNQERINRLWGWNWFCCSLFFFGALGRWEKM